MQAVVYDLVHAYETEQGEEEQKSLGCYSSREKAQEAIERYRPLPGFRQHPDAFVIYESVLDLDAAWTDGFVKMTPHYAVIYKIVPRAEWDSLTGDYHGSAHDRADGFLHFSGPWQLLKTLRRYYAGQDDLMLLAVDTESLGATLKWEHSESRDEDFPHLYAPLPGGAIKWARPITKDADGNFALPELDSF